MIEVERGGGQRKKEGRVGGGGGGVLTEPVEGARAWPDTGKHEVTRISTNAGKKHKLTPALEEK